VVTEDLEGMHGPGMVDATFDDNIQRKVVFVEFKKVLPVVDFHQINARPAPEFIQKELFLFSYNGMQKSYFHGLLR